MVVNAMLSAVLHILLFLGLKQKVEVLHLGMCLLFGSGGCCTQQHLSQPASEFMSKFCSWKKHIVVDNVLADEPDVKTWQDNVTESISCYKREAKRQLFLR